MPESVTILKQPGLPMAQDYTALRKQGIELIQRLGSNLWTDYNIHDPGITLLELLCYATTDIGYRQGFSMEDLLTKPDGSIDGDSQCFFTARRILTQNPWTPNDWRKRLIDLQGIRNAWHNCNPCGCSIELNANCKLSALQYDKTEHPIRIKGFNDIQVELDIDANAGDLNSGKIFQVLSFVSAGRLTKATIECRFAPWHNAAKTIPGFEDLIKPTSIIEPGGVKLLSISGNTAQSVDIPVDALYRALRNPLYANIEITYREKEGSTLKKTLLEDIPVKVWYRSDEDRKAITISLLRQLLEESSASGIANRYLIQLKKAAVVLETVAQTAHTHRNLSEDYCTISTIPICDVALCADIEMEPDADIESVLGQAYWQIEQYFNPTIPFYSLQQLLDKQMPVEEIFNGPPLQHGFVLNEDLDKAFIRTALYSSDVINILMDIKGIIAVKNIALARYNAQGKLVESQPWTLKIPAGEQPRLYVHASKVLVFKNDLPFLPDADELNDTLTLWKGQNRQNKLLKPDNDLSMPAGKYVNTGEQWPLQNMLPDTYGVGISGLPETASDERKAQARQLKGYMLVLEHLLQVYILQLQHFRELFSIDPSISQTWFAHLFNDSELNEASLLYQPGLSEPALQELLESHPHFVERRNRFLDQLLARFAENFADYSLHVYTLYGNETKAGEVLIADKIRFLQKFPEVSANRAKAFNYKNPLLVCQPGNEAGLQQRIRLLLGMNGVEGFVQYEVNWTIADKWLGCWKLLDDKGNLLLQSPMVKGLYAESTLRTQLVNAAVLALNALASPVNLSTVAAGTKFKVQLSSGAQSIATAGPFETGADADAHISAIQSFLKGIALAQKVLIVEHLLLRPRNKPSSIIPTGDALLPICIGPDCHLCGEEDPYSFRLTIVLNGEQSFGLANQGIAFRRYAEKAIRMEVPAHLGVKICWVGAEELTAFEQLWCNWLTELAKPTPDTKVLHERHKKLLALFEKLKSVYPPASLHDCVDGDDENRVYLNNTVI